MRLDLTQLTSTVSRSFPVNFKVEGKDRLLFQRLSWGTMAGCISTLFIASLPWLQGFELSMLEWHYRIASKLESFGKHRPISRDISLVTFDNDSQWEFNDKYQVHAARFNAPQTQSILAEVISRIESGNPAVVAVDLDLRGATDLSLVEVMQRYRKNIVVGLFGSLEGSTELPPAEFFIHPGYDELPREDSGIIVRLPIAEHQQVVLGNPLGVQVLAPIASMTESIVDVHRQNTGVGTIQQIFRAIRRPTAIHWL